MKTVRLLSMLVIVALLFGALGTGSLNRAAAQDNTIKIASQSPLSGSQSSLGVAIRNGTDLAIQQLKKPIEDMGFKVEYVPFDDQATADVGVANAQNIVNDAAILAVIGHLNSGVAIPSSEVYAKSNLVMVSPANTNPKVTDRDSTHLITNRVCGRDDIQGPVGAIYAAKKLGVKTVYILSDHTAYGDGVANAFKDEATKQGLQILGAEATDETSNFDAVLTPVAAQNPDLLYWGGIYDRGGPLFKQARAKGIKSQFLGADGMDSTDLVKLGGDAIIGTIFTTTAGPADLFPDAKQFITDYEKTFNATQVETYAPEAYAATQVVLNGITQAIKGNGGKLPTRAQVAAAVRATKDLPTIIGPMTFDVNGDPIVATYYTDKIVSSDPSVYSTTGKQVVDTVKANSPHSEAATATMAATASQ